MNVVAVQGDAASYSALAVGRLPGPGWTPLYCTHFADVIDRVRDGSADHALLPWRNTIIGPIRDVRSLVRRAYLAERLRIALDVSHCLITRAPVAINTLREVHSHAAALQQCRGFFTSHPWIGARPHHDTGAGLARILAHGSDREGAIAGAHAVDIHGGHVLIEGIQDRRPNVTEFRLFSR